MIERRNKEEEPIFEVYCFTCRHKVSDFILISPPQWADPKNERSVTICVDCAKKIGEKTE